MSKRIRIINGIKFKFGEFEWHDAFSRLRSPLPDLKLMQKGKLDKPAIIRTSGWYAKIGPYYVVISEIGYEANVFDFTIIPVRPKTKLY
jgi:hypothetical protein